ncbi:hypothetical protein BY458DRAFT_559458 [Sporodiniella umbellata]|nr:hypothetical protein BY458DRAFT_559458 [Sporodiniella umbellata]
MSSYYRQQDIYLSQSEGHYYDENEGELISITQNLGKEQYRFEFPTKSSLDALDALDHGDDRFSFFDPHSFHSAEHRSAQESQPMIHSSIWHETVVDDSRLSPLHLPIRCDTSSPQHASSLSLPVNPSHFLKADQRTATPIRQESARVLIQLNPHRFNQPITILHSSRSTASMSDEGYDDTEEEGKELESDVRLIPIHDPRRHNAARKIQACWRAHLAQQPPSLHARIRALERQLEQETAMRRAFEGTVENMTVLIDQQQKILYDRLEEEVLLRQAYEAKMIHAFDQLQPLQHRLAQESKARLQLEATLTGVLDRLARLESPKKETKPVPPRLSTRPSKPPPSTRRPLTTTSQKQSIKK